jgi:LPS export ABC transporter protein LptC
MGRRNEPRARGYCGAARGRGRLALAAGWLAAALLSAVGCERQQSLPPASPEVPDQVVRQFSLTETVNGDLRWKLTAQSASTYRNLGIIRAADVAIEFYDQAGKPYSHLVARQGEIRTATNDMAARGNVVVTTESGTRVETQSLRFLNREQRIVSEDRVTVRRGGDVLTGVGFESDPSLEHFEFHRQVRAQVSGAGGRIRVRERGKSP